MHSQQQILHPQNQFIHNQQQIKHQNAVMFPEIKARKVTSYQLANTGEK